MAVVPTYLYFGDGQISGAVIPPTAPTGLPTLWAFWRNNPRFNQRVPSSQDGYTSVGGGVWVDFKPYWDGQMLGGAGKFVHYHHAEHLYVPDGADAPAIPAGSANGDNWFLPSGGGVSPMTLLMRGLWDRHPTGFRALKYGAVGGYAAWKAGGTSFLAAKAEWDKMVAAEPGNTLDVIAIVLDCSASDIAVASPTYADDQQAAIDNLRAVFGSTAKIILVSHRSDFGVNQPGFANSVRQINNAAAAANAGVHVFDMSWAQFGTDGFGSVLPGPNKTTYQTDDYAEMGDRLVRFIAALLAPAVATPPAGQGLAAIIMLGDSNMLSAFMESTSLLVGRQGSILGYDPNDTSRELQYVWHNRDRQVQQYDVMSNANTFGPPGPIWFGPENTMLKEAVKTLTGGVLVFKVAVGGASLQAFPSAMVDIEAAWVDCRAAALRDLGRTIDSVAVVVMLGTNDSYLDAHATAFASLAPQLVDESRRIFTTRATGDPLPVIWVQPPPHVGLGIADGSYAGIPSANLANRTTVANLPTLREKVGVVLDPGGKYELQRTDHIHYGAEAVMQLGYDIWDKIAEQLSDEAETEDAVVTTGLPSETAAFIVEDGTGLSDALSLCSVEFTTQYAELYGNAMGWISATPAQKRDALRQASRWVSTKYVFQGRKVSVNQAQAFPRVGLTDEDGFTILSTIVPRRVMEAVSVAAIRIATGDWQPFPDEQAGSTGASESVSVGPISFSTSATSGSTSTEVKLPVIAGLLRPFLRSRATYLGRG